MKKTILISILIVLMLVSTGTAYAFWDQTSLDEENNVIQIGVGAILEITQIIDNSAGTTLIPEGTLLGETDVNELVFSYTLQIDKIAQLHICVSDVMIDSSTLNAALVIIDIYTLNPNDPADDDVTVPFVENEPEECFEVEVFVKVTLDMPTTVEQYNAVAGKPISFILEFDALEV